MGALANLRVLDLTQILAGPYCTMMLADMGADVVKIERPGGERIRSNPPFVADPDTEAFGGYFQSVNRGKRSLELDLRDETDRDHFLSLVETADVLVENFKSGTMERLDLGYETLTEYNPQLIYSTIRDLEIPGPAQPTGRASPPTISSRRRWAVSWRSPDKKTVHRRRPALALGISSQGP